MAINKNFVIKNGVQVGTDLIVGDSDTKKVGIGTTIAGYTLHVAATNAGGRGGIGATDAVITGVGTIKDLLVTGFSGFSSDISVTGVVSARSFGIGTTEIIDRGMRLSGIASLDAITINTIEQAIRVGPNSFTDLKVTGISTFIGIATFSTGIDIKSGVSTFSAPLRLGFAHTTDHAGVALGATVGFGTSAFFRDDAAIFMGSDSDLKIHHDGSNSRIQDVGTGDLIIQGSADIKLQSASAENYIVANDTGSVDVYFDNSKKLETTSGGLKVTGITTLTDRLHVEAGISTFDADVRFGIGATVGFGTSAFFKDEASIFMGDADDFELFHDGSDSIIRNRTGDLKLLINNTENGIVIKDNEGVEAYFDNSKKTETTSGGFKVTGITTLTNRLHVQAGVSTFDADVRFGIGATVGFGTSAFFRDNAAIFMGDQEDLKIFADQDGDVRIQQQNAGKIIISSTGAGDAIQLQARHGEQSLIARVDGAVEQYYDNSKKTETTSGGFNITGITTFSDRINVVSGVSTFQDDAKLTFGAQTDLLIQHDGNNSEIYNKTGDLIIRANDLDIQDYSNGHNMITAIRDGSVDLYYDNYNAVQTTPQGINVSGVTTSNRLNISGVSTFTSIGSNLIPDTDGSRNIGAAGSEWQDLHIDGTANIDTLAADTAAIADLTDNRVVIAGSSGELEDDANFTFDGSKLNVGSGVATVFVTTGNAAFSGIVTANGGLSVGSNGSAGVAASIFTNGNASFSGITTIGAQLDCNSSVDIASGLDVNSTQESTNTTTGCAVFDGGVGIAKNLNVGGNLTVTGTTTFNGGTITLGDAATDNVVFSADVDSSITPDDDDTYDLGSTSKEWRDLHIDGIAHLDNVEAGIGTFSSNLLVSGISTFSGNVNVGSGVTIQPNGNLAAAGIVTANGGLLVGSNAVTGVAATIATNGNAAFSGIVTVAGISQHRIVIGGANGELIDDGNLSFNTSSNVLTVSGSIDLSTDIDVDGTANLDDIDVDGTANFADDVTLVAAGSSTILFDASAHKLVFQDNIRAKFGTGEDLAIYHDSLNSYIQDTSGTGRIKIVSNEVQIKNAADNETMAQFAEDGAVTLYHNNQARVTTTTDGTDFGGTGSIRVPVGTTGERNSSPAAGDFRYNSDEGKFEGYTDSWGEIGGGSVEETDTSVSTTSATSCGSFAKADFRSAAIIAQITQGSNYQVGRYLLIHDGTTVTTIEESAVATGSMLGTFEGVINGSNVEFRVTMGSSSSATVTTKIDTVTV